MKEVRSYADLERAMRGVWLDISTHRPHLHGNDDVSLRRNDAREGSRLQDVRVSD